MLTELEVQIRGRLYVLPKNTSARTIESYEAKIDALERDKPILEEQNRDASKPKSSFEDMFDSACQILDSPC